MYFDNFFILMNNDMDKKQILSQLLITTHQSNFLMIIVIGQNRSYHNN